MGKWHFRGRETSIAIISHGLTLEPKQSSKVDIICISIGKLGYVGGNLISFMRLATM